MTQFRGHVRLTVMDSFFCQLLLIARSWSEVQDSELSHRHGARLPCSMIYFGHHVILTSVSKEWDDAPRPPGFSKTAKNKCALHLHFFSTLWAIIAQLLVTRWPGQVRQRSFMSQHHHEGMFGAPAVICYVLYREGHTSFKSRQDVQS